MKSVLRKLLRYPGNLIGRHLGYGSCLRCGDTWNHTKCHSTWYSEESGLFPLCERCWAKLSPTERMSYYKQLLHRWGKEEELWPLVEKSLMEGK